MGNLHSTEREYSATGAREVSYRRLPAFFIILRTLSDDRIFFNTTKKKTHRDGSTTIRRGPALLATAPPSAAKPS
jgi:hypothetical protein